MAKVEAIYFPSMSLLIGLSTLLTIAVGGWYHIHQQYNVTAGTIAEFVLYINFITFPVSAIGWTASMVQRAAVSQRRLNEFLHTKPTIKDKCGITPVVFNSKDIVVNNLSYTYLNTGIKALNNVRFEIKNSERVLLFGKTGSGKSTLAQLILRFYDADSGSISIGQHKVEDIPLTQLRETIGFVPQDIFLFSDTVAGNIGFGLEDKETQEVIENAAKMAGVHKDIMGFAEQYNTMIGERGVTLSGGQKQRISIARALIKQPDIVMLDDCLSAVDAKTEHEIIGNLDRVLANKTAIIITHRIFTHLKFDKVIVIENGSITEIGRPEELLQRDNYYSQMYKLQMMQE